MKQVNHVRIQMGQEMKFICEHCDDSYQLNLPAPFSIVEGAGKGWLKTHKGCRKPKVKEEEVNENHQNKT